MLKSVVRYLFLLALFLVGWSALRAQVHSPERYEIDVKNQSVRYNDRDALLRAREFVRLDPSYYVGYMVEGLYKYEHSSDYLGYKSAIPPLLQAFNLFEKDYSGLLKARYDEQSQWVAAENRIWDYYRITDNLMECYSNIEHPDSVVWLLNRYKKWNMQYDILGADNYLAWTYHRNRYYTKDKFSFLHNTVEENEKAALNYLHQSMQRIDKNAELNERALSYSMVLRSRLSVYHYLALVYDYQRKPDSARYCYDQMITYNTVSRNNYAIFCFVNGEFEESYKNFMYDFYYHKRDKMLQESIYYLSILNTMRGSPQSSIKPLIEFVEDNKSRPGWGWYNIALARAYLYSGQLAEGAKCLKKASSFREIHIGTTLGESQYNFSSALLDLINNERQAAAIKFEDRHYWLSPTKLKQIAELKVQQSAIRLALFNQLSANPERDELYYRLFASESTVSFDEIYALVKDYGRSFFIKKFEQESKRKGRDNIKKYFNLLQAKLYIEKGKTRKAKEMLEKIKKKTEGGYENLFLARLYEALAICEDDVGSNDKFEDYRTKQYTTFPQLMPYSEVKMEFFLDVKKSDNNKLANTVVDELESCNISWTSNKKKEVPRVVIRFSTKGNKNIVSYKVESPWGKTLVSPQTVEYDKAEGVGKQIAYGLFKIGIVDNTDDDELDYY